MAADIVTGLETTVAPTGLNLFEQGLSNVSWINLNSTTTEAPPTTTSGNQTYSAPYEPPVEIVVLLSLFYGAISLVAVLGKN